MPSPKMATSVAPRLGPTDAVREAVERLQAYLPEGEECEVLADFLEDDLREGLLAVADVEAHFADIVELLTSERPTPIRLLEAADDLRALSRLEYLFVAISQLRRRLNQVAGRVLPRARDGRSPSQVAPVLGTAAPLPWSLEGPQGGSNRS